MAVQPTLLLIADIAGYTRFMKMHDTSLAHAQQIIADLLEAVIDAAGPNLKLAKLEGDAAFFYMPAPADDARAKLLVELATDLLAAARDAAPSDAELVQVEAATEAGSVFLVGDTRRRIVATTEPEPTVGLVFYDLKSCLRGVEVEDEKPKRPARRRKAEGGDAA